MRRSVARPSPRAAAAIDAVALASFVVVGVIPLVVALASGISQGW